MGTPKAPKERKPPYTRLPDEVRQAVIADLRTGQYGRNEIAARNNVGRATVTYIAQEENLDPSAKAAMTQAATRAVAVDTQAKRERLKHDLLDDIQRLRVRAWSPWSREVVTKEGIEKLKADMPPLPEVASAYRAIGNALEGFFKLEAMDLAKGDTVQGSRDFLLDLRQQMEAVRNDFETTTGLPLDSPEARVLIQGEVVQDEDGT